MPKTQPAAVTYAQTIKAVLATPIAAFLNVA